MNGISESQTQELLENMGVKLRVGATVKDLMKSLSSASLPGTGTGMFPYNLEETAMILTPERTPLSNQGIYGVKGGEDGTSKEYRAIVKGNARQASGYAGEADDTGNTGRGVNLRFTNLQRKKVFAYTAPEASVSLIEELTGGKFDPVGAYELASLIQAREIEERQILGSCATLLGTTTNLATTAFSSGGSLAVLTTYRVAVTPINYWLWWKYFEATATADIPALATADPDSGLNPGTNSRFGEGIAATTSDISVAAGGRIEATWDDIPGAQAYAVYLSLDSGTTYNLVGLATGNGFTIKSKYYRPGLPVVVAKPNTGTDLTTSDNQGFPVVQDGFYSQSVLDADVPGFLNNLANSSLSAHAAGSGCVEIDDYLDTTFSKFGYSPEHAWCGPKTLSAVSSTVLGSGAPSYRLNKDADANGEVKAGAIVTALFNKNTKSAINLFGHPLMPEGHIYFHKQKLPFPQARIPTGQTMVYHNVVRYFKQRFARTKAQNLSGPWAITSYGGFCHYFPSGDGVLKGIKIN